MKIKMSLISESVNILLKQTLIRSVYHMQQRHSQWSKEYMSPIVNRNELQELESSGALKELAFKPIKAALSDQVCSVFYDKTLNQVIRLGTIRGHKALMREFMRETFAIVKRIQIEKYNNADNYEHKSSIECNPLTILHKAIANCRPLLITRAIKRGGATYQVPYPLSERESQELAIKWLIHSVRDRPKPKKAHFPECMAKELIDAFYNEGKVVKKKQDMHKQCEANKAYAHYRWG